MKPKYYNITGILTLLVLIFLLTTPSFKKQMGIDSQKQKAVLKQKKKYVCSMHPEVIRDEPGDCPICGMLLIEKIDQDKNGYDTTLTDVTRSVNKSVLGSVSAITPEQASLPLVIEASGIINYDPRKIQTVSARFGGLIERSFVKYEFQHIRYGQKIYEIYCPDIYTEQWNYVKLVQAYPDNDELTTEALEWLNLLGLSKGQIDSLKRTVKPEYHLPVYSHVEGYVVNSDFDPENFFFSGNREERDSGNSLAGAGSVGLSDGIKVETGSPLFKIIDIKALRVDLKVKTEDGSLLRRGQKVVITDAANPDRKFKAEINQIEPLNGGLFQTVKVYITDNERLLLPGRQIKALIMAGDREGLWVPVTAVVELGRRRSVFVMKGNKFVSTEVRTGLRSNDKIEILSGIDRNTKIAEKALLLTDSDGLILTD